jgi:hypothetical protein
VKGEPGEELKKLERVKHIFPISDFKISKKVLEQFARVEIFFIIFLSVQDT